jgi:hypothetical protein
MCKKLALVLALALLVLAIFPTGLMSTETQDNIVVFQVLIPTQAGTPVILSDIESLEIPASMAPANAVRDVADLAGKTWVLAIEPGITITTAHLSGDVGVTPHTDVSQEVTVIETVREIRTGELVSPADVKLVNIPLTDFVEGMLTEWASDYDLYWGVDIPAGVILVSMHRETATAQPPAFGDVIEVGVVTSAVKAGQSFFLDLNRTDKEVPKDLVPENTLCPEWLDKTFNEFNFTPPNVINLRTQAPFLDIIWVSDLAEGSIILMEHIAKEFTEVYYGFTVREPRQAGQRPSEWLTIISYEEWLELDLIEMSQVPFEATLGRAVEPGEILRLGDFTTPGFTVTEAVKAGDFVRPDILRRTGVPIDSIPDNLVTRDRDFEEGIWTIDIEPGTFITTGHFRQERPISTPTATPSPAATGTTHTSIRPIEIEVDQVRVIHLHLQHTWVAPFYENFVTYIPLRFLVEYLGGDVTWLGDSSTVHMVLGDHTFMLTPGQREVLVDFRPYEISDPPVIRNGRTMVPLEYVHRILGLNTRYVARCDEGVDLVVISTLGGP